MARIAHATAAPPAMSSFIRSMPSAGLIEMPPVSNVMPLPTRPSTGPGGAPGGSWRNTISRGGSLLPRATPSSRPIPSCAMRSSSRISTLTPPSVASAAARRANSRGVSALPGSLASSRARLLHSPSSRPRSTADARAAHDVARLLGQRRRSTRGASGGAGSPVLYVPTLNSDSVSPSATACASSTTSPRPRSTKPPVRPDGSAPRSRRRRPAAAPARSGTSAEGPAADQQQPTRPASSRSVSEVANSSNVLPVEFLRRERPGDLAAGGRVQPVHGRGILIFEPRDDRADRCPPPITARIRR